MLGLPGFRVLNVDESAAEVVIEIERPPIGSGARGCGVLARAHDRMGVEYRDLAAFGRPARLVWAKRRWRCEGSQRERTSGRTAVLKFYGLRDNLSRSATRPLAGQGR